MPALFIILTTLILIAPPMAAMFFQGTLGSFMAYSQIGGGPAAQAPGPSGQPPGSYHTPDKPSASKGSEGALEHLRAPPMGLQQPAEIENRGLVWNALQVLMPANRRITAVSYSASSIDGALSAYQCCRSLPVQLSHYSLSSTMSVLILGIIQRHSDAPDAGDWRLPVVLRTWSTGVAGRIVRCR